MDPISPDIKQTILEAKENGLTRMEICLKTGYDWEVVMHCLEKPSPKIIEKDMFHQNCRYTFKWVKYRHNITSQDTQSRILFQYLSKIAKSRYPKEYFNDGSVQRISQFRLNRLKRGIVAEIGKTLIRKGYITETLSIHNLTKIAKHLFAEHANAQKLKPSHDDIQTRILKEDPYSIAMEVPIWGEPPVTPDIVTGHIDLLRLIDDSLYVVDYKPENNFMPSVPQVAFYGFLLQKNLNLKNIKCASFSNKRIWEFQPDILNNIQEILIEHNINFFNWQRYI
jgi:hypothetical protein